MRPIDLILAILALWGHTAICVGLMNRAHATGISRRLVKMLTVVAAGWGPIGLMAVFRPYFAAGETPAALEITSGKAGWWLAYFAVCWIAALAVIVRWLRRTFWIRRSPLLLSNHTTTVQIAQQLGHRPVHGPLFGILGRLPGNQSLVVHVHDESVELPRLDAALDGLSILHLSDFHFTGRVGKPFFREAIRLVAPMQPDLIALTGDYVDDADCIDWIPELLSPLSARYGIFFVLGNHDPRVRQTPRLRRALSDCGFVDVSGRWQRLEIAGREIVLAGNEMPWIRPEPDLSNCPIGTKDRRPLRVLLTHTPDNLAWARRHDIDLMLAGHTHGGQICLPGIGAVLCPSRFGVAYASGIFHERPTVMHVSRGLSGEHPLRWNCPPEIAKLVLRSPAIA